MHVVEAQTQLEKWCDIGGLSQHGCVLWIGPQNTSLLADLRFLFTGVPFRSARSQWAQSHPDPFSSHISFLQYVSTLYNMFIFAVSVYTFCIFLPGHFLWAQGLNRATVHRAHAQTTNCLEEPVPRELQGSVHFVLSKACTIFRSFFLQLLRQAFEQQMAAMSWRPVRKLLIVSGVLQAAVPQTLQTYRNVQKRVLSTFCQESSRSFE